MPEPPAQPEPPPLEFAVTYAYADAARAARLHSGENPTLTVVVAIGLIGVVLWVIFAVLRDPVMVHDALMRLGGLVAAALIPLLLVRLWKKRRYGKAGIRYFFSPAGIRSVSANREVFHAWSLMTHYRESRHLFLLYYDRQRYTFIPKRDLPDLEIGRLRELLCSFVGHTKFPGDEPRFPVMLPAAPASSEAMASQPPAATGLGVDPCIPMDPAIFRATFSATREEWLLASLPKNRGEYFIVCAKQMLSVLLVAGCFLFLFSSDPVARRLVVFIAPVMLLAVPFTTKPLLKAHWRKIRRPEAQRTVMIGETGITWSIPQGWEHDAWAHYTDYRELAWGFCLYRGGSVLQYLPLRCFESEAQLDALRDILRRKIGRTEYELKDAPRAVASRDAAPDGIIPLATPAPTPTAPPQASEAPSPAPAGESP